MNTSHPFKNYWFWVVAVLVIGVSFFYVSFDLPASNSRNLARLTIEFDKDNVKTFEGPVVDGMTVLQALNSASLGGGFDFRYSLDKDGSVSLASIGGAVNGPKNWHFFLNGKLIEIEKLDKIKISGGDSIEARYE
jgi:hypothetical protein